MILDDIVAYKKEELTETKRVTTAGRAEKAGR